MKNFDDTLKTEKVNDFAEIKSRLDKFASMGIAQNKIGAEIATEKLTDKNLSEQLSILDEQDKKIALKLLCIEQVLLNPPDIFKDNEKSLFLKLGDKTNKVRVNFMTICKSTGGKTQENIKDIFSSGMTINDNTNKPNTGFLRR